jgi:hypothetical protein
MKFSHSAITAQLTQDFEKESPYLVDDKDWPYGKYQKKDAIRELLKDFFDPYMTLLDQNKRIRQQQEHVGWNRNPEENVTTNETNENPAKKPFSHDTAKE